MRSGMTDSRPTSIEESIINSIKEVNLMRAGKLEKPTLDNLFANIEIWVKEDNKDVQSNSNRTISTRC